MKKSFTQIILETLENGKETLNEIKVLRKTGQDPSIAVNNKNNVVSKYHRNMLNLVVSEIIEETNHAKTFRLTSNDEFELPVFESGQYLNIFVNIDGVRTSRPISISSSCKQRGYYDITVHRIKTGFVSDYFLDTVKVGDTFEGNGPAGLFTYNKVAHSKEQVFIAGGSGVTPFASMIREALSINDNRSMHLIYGVRNEEYALFLAEFKYLASTYDNFTFDLVCSDDKNYQGHTGFINQELIAKLVEDLTGKTFYVCGPEVMNILVTSALEKLGVKGKDIRRELFGARQDIYNEVAWPTNLKGDEVFKIKIGDLLVDAKCSESILTSLERAGVRHNVCCRSGECSLCRVRLVSGEVFMPRGVLLRHADEKYGFIHSCKAYPISDIEIIL